jgi:hypothetical protein
MKKVLFLAAFAVLALAVSASATPSLSATYSFSDDSPRAGSTVFYYVAVSNSGTSTAEDVKVSLIRSDSSYATTQGPGSVELGDLPAGSSTVATFAIKLASTDIGVKRINTVVYYDYGGSEYEIKQDAYVSVESRQLQVMSVSSNEAPLVPGEISQLDIRIANRKNEGAKDFDIDFTSDSYLTTTVFKPLGGSSKYVEKQIGEDAYIDLSYDIYVDESVPSGVYDITLSVNYLGGNVEKSETLTIGVWVRGDINLDLATVSTDPTELMEGEEDATVSITVQNIGQEQIKNLKMTFDPEAPFMLTASSQATQNLGILSVSSSVSADYYIDVDESAASGAYDLPVALSYQDSRGQSYEENLHVTLRLKPVPIVSITRSDAPTVIQGESSSVRLYLKNEGEKEAEGTSVRVFEKIEQPFSYEEKSDNVGLLKSGEEGEAVINFDVDAGAEPKEYIMEFEVRYTDGDDVYTETESVTVSVLPAEDSGFPMELVIVLLVVIVVVTIIWKITSKKGMLR